jgi:spastic paraplegia protein 7
MQSILFHNSASLSRLTLLKRPYLTMGAIIDKHPKPKLNTTRIKTLSDYFLFSINQLTNENQKLFKKIIGLNDANKKLLSIKSANYLTNFRINSFSASSPTKQGNDNPFRNTSPYKNPNQNNQDSRPPNPNMFQILISFLVFSYVVYSIGRDIHNFSSQQPTSPAQIANGSKQPAGANPQAGHQINFVQKNSLEITWNEFVSVLLANKLVDKIYAVKESPVVFIALKKDIVLNGQTIHNGHLTMRINSDELEAKLDRVQNDLKVKQEDRVPIVYKENELFTTVLNGVISIAILLVIMRYFSSLGRKLQSSQTDLFSGFTKAKYTMVDPHLKSGVPNVTFKDVAGLHEAKIEVKEFVDYLSHPEKYVKLGAKVPKGALLLGPPGCGKTLLAKAVASEANVPFFNIAGSEFIEVIGGVGAARVRSLFDEAKKQSPAIIYIDEIDAIGKKRSSSDQYGGSGESDQTLNQLLVCMDGLESNSNVIVLASTNRADTLDKALLRPGRLDRHISIDLPTYLERIEILNVHLKNLKLAFREKEKEEFVGQLASLTPRFSGADLMNICNEGALLAARNAQTSISKKDLFGALEKVIGGPEKKTSTMTVEDRKMLAYRECGHIIVSWFHQYSDLVLKVSMLTRTKTNAFSQYLPSGN